MGYTAPTTRATGYLVTAATWNTEHVDDITFLANPPACRVYHNTTQSIADNTEVDLIFNSERYDTDSMHSTISDTGRITFNTAGLYIVTATLRFPAGTDYVRAFIGIRLGGTTYIVVGANDPNATSFDKDCLASTVYKFAATEFIVATAFQDNTANAARNAQSAGNHTPEFSATWIGLG